MLSPHIGDLDTPEACAAHEQAEQALTDLYREPPALVCHDAHPDYASTRLAQARFENCMAVQHHYAHALSCMADNGLEGACFAVAWDGTGYGDDDTIWGGEFLTVTQDGYGRTAHLLPFPLPGGDAAAKDPRRVAFGLLHSMGVEPKDFGGEQTLMGQAIEKNINAPLSSSMGRLFDGVAALAGLCAENSFEGEAAMALEFAAIQSDCAEAYDFEIRDGIVDWRPMVAAVLQEGPENRSRTARRFHNTLAAIIVAAAQGQAQRRILLTGGCFQNKLLLESAVSALCDNGFEPYWHHNIPPNDGGLAAGQVLAALRGQA